MLWSVVVLIPFAIAACAQLRHGWAPAGENAQAYLRWLAFWEHPPTLGAVSRLGSGGMTASHPGPATWWMGYPVYWAAGGGPTGVVMAVVALGALWAVVTVRLLAPFKATPNLEIPAILAQLGMVFLVLLARTLGPTALTEPWNPWFGVFSFAVAIVATWRVLCGAPQALVFVVLAASYSLQAHLSYLPMVAVLGIVSLGSCWLQAREDRWVIARPVMWSVGVGAALWVLPVIEQFRSSRGNASVLLGAFRSPTEAPVGLGPALRTVVSAWAPSTSFVHGMPTETAGRSMSVGAAVVLVGWIATIVLGWRHREIPAIGALMRMHLLLGLLTGAAVVAISRTLGEVFAYLVPWLGVVVALAWATSLATLILLQSGRIPTASQLAQQRPGIAALVDSPASRPLGVLFLAGALLLLTAPRLSSVTLGDSPAERTVDEALPVLTKLLDPTDPLLIEWVDPVGFGGVGYGTLAGLERSQFRAFANERYSAATMPHRVRSLANVERVLWIVSGPQQQSWDQLVESGQAERLVVIDPRSDSQRRQFEHLHELLRMRLVEIERDGGPPTLLEALDQNLWSLRSDPRLTRAEIAQVDELASLGVPTAFYLTNNTVEAPQPT